MSLEAKFENRTVEMDIDLVGDRLSCVAIRVVANPGMAVVGDDLRRLPIAGLVGYAAHQMLWRTETHDGYTTSDGPVQPPEGFPGSGPTDEALRYIAGTYHVAHAVGMPPTKAVEGLGLTYSTAARWVALARAAGYLSRTAPGKSSGMASRRPKPPTPPRGKFFNVPTGDEQGSED